MEYIEINREKETIRLIKKAKNKDEAIEHVLFFNRIFVLDVESIEDIKGTLEQFFEDMRIEHYDKIGLFQKEME